MDEQLAAVQRAQVARRRIAELVGLPPGYSLRWGGQFEHLISASRRLAIVVPLAPKLAEQMPATVSTPQLAAMATEPVRTIAFPASVDTLTGR